jgi:hypothetical protein
MLIRVMGTSGGGSRIPLSSMTLLPDRRLAGEAPVMVLRGSWGISGQKRGVGKGASLDYNEGMTKLACLQRMVL